jgi:hypothetical protein
LRDIPPASPACQDQNVPLLKPRRKFGKAKFRKTPVFPPDILAAHLEALGWVKGEAVMSNAGKRVLAAAHEMSAIARGPKQSQRAFMRRLHMRWHRRSMPKPGARHIVESAARPL